MCPSRCLPSCVLQASTLYVTDHDTGPRRYAAGVCSRWSVLRAGVESVPEGSVRFSGFQKFLQYGPVVNVYGR